MKQILFLVITSLIFGSLYSQERIYKPFRVDIGVSINFLTNNEAGFGGGAYVEPRYNINNKFIIGLRLENAQFGSSNVFIDFTSVKVSSTSIFDIQLIGEYFFSTERVRPFIGLGLGMYKKNTGSVSISAIDGIDIGPKTITNFGFAPRIGINAGHFRLATLYNYTGNNITDYIGIQIGFEIGGGKINQ